NKSHAAAYGVVAVETGWLKAHYPVPFMAATMNSMLGNAPKIAGYIQYCRAHDIPVLPPDVNKSLWRFSVDTDDDGRQGIRFGLGGVKNVGHGAVEQIVRERAHSPYASIFDFVERTSGDAINKRTVESLIKAGAFDRLGHNRAQLMSVFETLMDETAQKRKANVVGQTSLFDLGFADTGARSGGLFTIPPMEEHPRK
ncbi:MAG: DNA polymerase III subunit alpha, partial [Clostridia bacterium]